MVSTLKLPVGIDSFEKIRRNNFYYIDKTKLIEQLVETGGEVTLFTRPRRFGKTLNMSMLKAFFETGADESLFDGLYIAQNKALCEEHMGKYPVIFLSLKSVDVIRDYRIFGKCFFIFFNKCFVQSHYFEHITCLYQK